MFVNANEEGYRHVSSSAVSSTHCLTPHSHPNPSNLPLVTKAYFVCHILPDSKSTRVIMRKTCQIKRAPLLAHSSYSIPKGENKYSNIGNQKRTVKVYITSPLLTPPHCYHASFNSLFSSAIEKKSSFFRLKKHTVTKRS